MHNDTDYGLSCAVITEDFRKARRIRDDCEYGLGYVNLPTIGAEVHLPFGGVKKSGTGLPSASTLIDVVTHRTAWTVNHAHGNQDGSGTDGEVIIHSEFMYRILRYSSSPLMGEVRWG